MKLRPKPIETASRWGTPNTAGVSIPHELAFEDIALTIDGTDILKGISMTAKTGSVTCLLGPSGSGKTTLLRIAAGMERQSRGKVLLDGEEISGDNSFLQPEKRGVGLVFQDYALFPHLTIVQNVMFGLTHLQRGSRAAQAMKMLGRVGLDDRAEAYPHHLSGGEQQRVALARALAPRPGVLLMDEPFSGLDSRLRDTMRQETLGILRETRATSVIVTHDPEEALRMGDQIVLLHDGRLAQAGSGRDLYFKPQSLFAAGFFSELNVCDAVVNNGVADTPFGQLAAPKMADATKVSAAVRIGSVVVRAKTASDSGPSGRILGVQFTGDNEYLRIGIPALDEPLRVRVRAGSLSSAALKGAIDVVIHAKPEGTFIFPNQS